MAANGFGLLPIITATPNKVQGETPAPVTVKKTAVSCQRCGERFFTVQAIPTGVACPICAGKIITRGTVRGDGFAEHHEQRMACNAICQGAKGQHCDCACLGANHGAYRTVTVTVVDGKVSLSLDHPERLGNLAARRHVLSAYRRGEWLPAGSFGRVRIWQEWRTEVRRVMKLRTPSGRLRGLHKVADELAEAAA